MVRRDLGLKAEYQRNPVAGAAKNGEVQALCVELEVDTSVGPSPGRLLPQSSPAIRAESESKMDLTGSYE